MLSLALYVLQLFMCAMWLLLQLAVVLLYWDVPPLDSMPEQYTALRPIREEEERPLVGSQGEGGTPGSGYYARVLSDQAETPLSEELEPSEAGATPTSDNARSLDDPFHNFSASQGAYGVVIDSRIIS